MAVSRVNSSLRSAIEKWAAAYRVNANLLESLVLFRSGGSYTEPSAIPGQGVVSYVLESPWQRLLTLPGLGYHGIKSVSLREDTQAFYFFDLTIPSGWLDIRLTLKTDADDLTLTYTSPVTNLSTSATPVDGQALIFVNSTEADPISPGTYRIQIDAKEEVLFDLEVIPGGEPIESRLYGVAQISLARARSVDFAGTEEDLEEDDTNIKTAARILQQAETVCGKNDTACLVREFEGASTDIPSAASGVERIKADVDLDESTPFTRTTSDPNFPNQPPSRFGPSDVNLVQVSGGPPCINDVAEVGGIQIPYEPPPSPYFPYFTITIGDDFTITPRKPQYVNYFEYTEEAETWASLRVRMYDPYWNTEEIALDQAVQWNQQPPVTLTFGYITRQNEPDGAGPSPLAQWVTEPKTLFLWDYQINFLGHGMEMTFEARGADYLPHTVGRRDTYQQDTPDQVVREICEERHGMDLCMEEASEVPRYGMNSPSYQPKKHIQSGESDMTHLFDQVIPEMVTAERGNQSAYTMWYDPAKNLMHCHPFAFGEGPVVRQYTYNRTGIGSVIQWAPTIRANAHLAYGGGSMENQVLDGKTAEILMTQTDDFNAPEIYESPDAAIPGLMNKLFASVDGGNRREKTMGVSFPTAADNWQTAHNINAYMRQNAFGFSIVSNLIIIGDPLIKIGKNVAVIVQNNSEGADGRPKTKIHWTSAIWAPRKITHVIQNGEYITQMELIRSHPIQYDGYIPVLAPPTAQNFRASTDTFSVPGITPTVIGDIFGAGSSDPGNSGGDTGQPGPGDERFYNPGVGYTKITELTGLQSGEVRLNTTLSGTETNKFYVDVEEDVGKIQFGTEDIGDGKIWTADWKIVPPPGTEGAFPEVETKYYYGLVDGSFRYIPEVGFNLIPRGTWLFELSNIQITHLINSDGQNSVRGRVIVRPYGEPNGTSDIQLSAHAAVSGQSELSGTVTANPLGIGQNQVSQPAGTNQTFNFNPGNVPGATLFIGPNSPMDLTVTLTPPPGLGLPRRIVRDNSEIVFNLKSSNGTLDGRWVVETESHTDSSYHIYYVKDTNVSNPQQLSLQDIAPDGDLNALMFGEERGKEHIKFSTGETKIFYASVVPPFVPDGLVPKVIKFSWYEESGQGLGRLSVSIEQLTGSRKTLASDSPSSEGAIKFSSQNGTKPDDAALGHYVVTVTASDISTGGEYFRIGWKLTNS